jgi:integrase
VTYKIRPYRGNSDVLEVDITLRLPDGRLHRERKKSPVRSKSGTERWAAAREAEILRNALAPKPAPAEPERPPVPTLAVFWPRFIADHSRANRQKPSGIESKEYHFRQYLEPVLGALRIDQVTDAEIIRLKRYMTTELGGAPNAKSKGSKSASTINNCLSSLSKCLACAVEWGELPAMPCKIRRLKTQQPAPKFYDFEEYERLVEAASELDARVHLVVLLGGDAGLRKGEILALEQAACDTKSGRVMVEWNQVKKNRHATKGMEFRAVPMTSRLRAALQAHRHLRGPRLLLDDAGKPISERTLRTWLAAAQKAAKLPKASGELHILRHTFCSHLAMKGAPVTTIQKLAGHKHLVTTTRYMHLAPGETDRAIKLLERAAPATLRAEGKGV